MYFFIRYTLSIILPFGLVISVHTPSAATETQAPTGSINGRVTIDGQAASGVAVILQPAEMNLPPSSANKVKTDQEGRFRLTGLAAGRYILTVLAPLYAVPNESGTNRPGKLITLATGETLEGIEIKLVRGGVITGRVTDPAGKPVIGSRVNVSDISENGRRSERFTPNNQFMLETDDRGIYRVYGLPPGRYKVSIWVTTKRTRYPETFYPGVTDETKASIIPLTSGQEVTGIDIKLGPVENTFEVSGQVVEAESGRPVPYAMIEQRYETVSTDGQSKRTSSSSGHQANAEGKFHLYGLMPGHYALQAIKDEKSRASSEPVSFDITQSNITDLEIKLRRAPDAGGSISGTLVIEGTTDPAILAKRVGVTIAAYVLNRELTSQQGSFGRVGADGSFKLEGVSTGTARIYPSYFPELGYLPLRVERDGVAQPNSIEIGPNEQITGMRVVATYGNGSINGRLQFEGGAKPSGICFYVHWRRAGETSNEVWISMDVDERGRFLIGHLPAGSYELEAGWNAASLCGATEMPKLNEVKQTINVTNDSETSVTLVIKLRTSEPRRKP